MKVPRVSAAGEAEDGSAPAEAATPPPVPHRGRARRGMQVAPILTPVKTLASAGSARDAGACATAAHPGAAGAPSSTPPSRASAEHSITTTPVAIPSTQRRAIAREEAEEVKHSDFEPARRQLQLDGPSSPLAASPEVVALNKQTYLDSNEFKVRRRLALSGSGACGLPPSPLSRSAS